MASKRQTISEAIVQGLEAHGVEIVFGIPGTHNLALYKELSASKIRHITPRHEQGGGYAADAYTRACGKPGVIITTSGPGMTNVVTAAATAYADSVPMLIISPGPPTGVSAGEHGYLHEMKDQRAHMAAVVDKTYRVKSAAEAAHAINDVFVGWKHGRQRPAYIEIPLNLMEFEGEVQKEFIDQSVKTLPPSQKSITEAQKAIRDANDAVIVLGSGAKNAVDEITLLAEKLGAPVVTTVNGKGVFTEKHQLSLGATIRIPSVMKLIESASLVLVVGATLGDAEFGGSELKTSGTVIRVDAEYHQLHTNLEPDICVLASSNEALKAINASLNSENLTSLQKRNAVVLESIKPLVEKEILDMSPVYAEIHDEILSNISKDAIIVGDSAQVSYLGTAYHLKAKRYGQFLYPTRFATLGYGIPGGIGAALAQTGEQVIVLIGDGGAMFTIQEFATAVDLGLSLPVIIINNAGYEEIRQQMVAQDFQPLGVDVRAPDFALLGKALGGEGVSLMHASELGAAIKDAFNRKVPTIIELKIG